MNVRSNERLASTILGGFVVGLGLSKAGPVGVLLTAVGGGLMYRGVSGHCLLYQALGVDHAHTDAEPWQLTARQRAARSFNLLRSVTVQRTAEQVYGAWRKPETFARAMGHFATHTTLAAGRTQWTLRDPLGGEHSWTTEIVAQEPNKMIRWQTAESDPLIKSLTLELRAAPGDRGTEMKLRLRLDPPSGVLGAVLNKLFGKAPAWVIDRALGNMKSLLEAGELPSLEHNPAARASAQLRGAR